MGVSEEENRVIEERGVNKQTKGGSKGEEEGWQKLRYQVFYKDVDNKQERCGGRVGMVKAAAVNAN